MRLNTYTAFLGLLFFMAFNVISLPDALSQEDGDIFDLRFLTELDCTENILTANIQIRTQDDTFKIGISSVLFNYDETVLAFLDYESLNFDESNICIPGVPLAVWDAHQFSSSTPGIFNLTLLTEIASQSCPIIERDWIDIGRVRFTVKNMEAAPNLQFDTRNTTFNRNEPNDGTFGPAQGDLMDFNELLSAQCACAPPTLTADTLAFDCPQTTIEANVLMNDIATNPTISIVNNPIRGTASISPNGILTYTPTTPFCGEDALAYRVCNDGDQDCCSDAVVSISFSDDISPSIVNAPEDVTVACNALPVAPNVAATDNCQMVDLTMNEVIENGDCAGFAVHTRTWTAIDACGNTATHTQRITLVDQIEPSIECIDTVNILCENSEVAVIDVGQPTIADNCTAEEALVINFNDEVIAENCDNKIQKQIARTWTVIDDCGNSATCIQIINIIDDVSPVISCPRGLTVDCNQSIDPENLESEATATDNCSDVTISFSDDESMPTDCNFSTKTIIRTWTAVDACGNSSSCTQTISVIGTPCPEPVATDLTIYRCEKDIVDFKSILNVGDNAILSVSSKSDLSPIFNLQQYALPSTGCEIGQFEFTFEVYNLEQCLVEAGTLVINTIPNFIIDTNVSADNCTASLVAECPEFYKITWNTGSDSGVGTTYAAAPGTSGEVVFSVVFTGIDLPAEALTLPCVEKLYTINYNCATTCPEIQTEQANLTTCAGQNLDIVETLNLFGDSLNYTFTLIDTIPGISFGQSSKIVEVGNPFGCEMGTFRITVNGYDANECLIRTIEVTVQVLPKIEAFVQYETDSTFCSPKLILECPSLYNVDWKDNLGGTGVGNTYAGTGGTGGFVTFYVSPIDDNLSGLPCAVDSIIADFSCMIDCPQPIERQERLTVCAESEVNIIELLGLSENKRNTFDSDEIINGIYKVGNPFGCELGTKAFGLKCFDENQCLVETIILNIAVIPAIYGGILTTTDSTEKTCSLSLSLECPENYAISWEDSNGNVGSGLDYIGATNTSGTVKFTVDYLTDLPVLSSDSLTCFSQTFEGAYDCTIDCPEISTEEKTLTVCSGDALNVLDYLDISSNVEYEIVGIELDTANNYLFINEACGVKRIIFSVEIFDEHCPIKVISVTAIILPKIDGNIQYLSDSSFCTPKLIMSCEDAYEVTWSDNLGNTGVGNIYEAAGGTSGFVTFYVNALDTLNEIAFCGRDTFLADFSCDKDCPVTITEERTLNLCNGGDINMPDFLDLDSTFTYEISGIEIDDSGHIILTNQSCGIITKEFIVDIFDKDGCLIKVINGTLNVSPTINGNIRYESDSSFCKPTLILDCKEAFSVTWVDNLGNTGTGSLYEAAAGTAGVVTFYVNTLDTLNEIFCGEDAFSADFSCQNQIIDCPEPTLETMDFYGCHGEVFNLYESLQFSATTRYRVVDGDGLEDIKNVRLENDGVDCFIRQFRLAVEVMDERDCVIRSIFVSFNVLPKITGEFVDKGEDCGLSLALTCPNIYAVSWEDDLGNTGVGFSYEPEFGTKGVVNFMVSYKDTTIANLFTDATCYTTTFTQEFACCNPIGTACDDGDALTFNDIEDGNCGCFGTGCNLEHKGTVVDDSLLAACDLLIEMPDGTILEPAILPAGETLIVGQEIIFSFVEISDAVSICQAGKIVQIICLENTCPEAGTPCTDNNLATINDEQDGNCNCVGETVPEVISEIDLRLRPELDCQSNTYCLTLQAKAQQEDFTIGTSSIMVNYDPNALEFTNYTSTQFNENETCIAGTMSPWDEQKFDGTSVPGKFCLTMTLLTDSISCPEITTEKWEDIGVICFDIMNNDTTPDIKFDTVNTHFNSSSPNDGTRLISHGILQGIDADVALACEGNTLVSANELALKAMLQGPYKSNKQLMTDDLRKKGFIPLTEPYTGIPSFIHSGEGGGETTTLEVLSDNGDNAIVDWVFLELRSNEDSTLVIATRSALIQRDGDVVDVDGISNVRFVVPDGDYYVTIKHRNHLGVMTAEPISFLSTQTTSVDFTTTDTPTYGDYARLDVQNKMVLRGGNAKPDKYIILAGGGLGLPDRDIIFFDIFLSLLQSNPNIPITYNSVLHGYYGSDTNMDGKVKYQGPKNDIDAYIFFNVLFHPQNTAYRLNFAISEQIP